jgi:hypothetical protein
MKRTSTKEIRACSRVQLRGEYAYVAAGEGGLRVYDVAQIDQKGFSERITTAPVSRIWTEVLGEDEITRPRSPRRRRSRVDPRVGA